MLNMYQRALSSASYSKPNSSFIIMIGMFFSFKILTILSLNDWTKRQFRNLDKVSGCLQRVGEQVQIFDQMNLHILHICALSP